MENWHLSNLELAEQIAAHYAALRDYLIEAQCRLGESEQGTSMDEDDVRALLLRLDPRMKDIDF